MSLSGLSSYAGGVPSPSPLTRSSRETQLATVLTSAFFIGIALILVRPLFSTLSWMIFVQDDLLYYLKVAQNLAHGHGSTFNGVVQTNGYQPLWFLLLVALSYVTQNPRLILAFLAATNFIAAAATFILARKLLGSSGARPLLIFVFAAWTTLYSVSLFFYGMEVTLTVPLILGVLCLLHNIPWLEEDMVHTFAFGLLLSAMVLSRIDTLILGGLLLAGMLVHPALRRLIRARLLLGVTLGLLPVLLYFLLNHILFHTWLPVSGMAKELKFNHLPSLEPWRVFFHPLAAAYTLVLLTALLLLPFLARRLNPIENVIFPAVLVFPFLYYFILSCVSDWTLWGWYMYPIRTALCISFLIFCLWLPSVRILERPIISGLLVLTVFVGLSRLRWTQQQGDIYDAALDVQHFAARHAGTYAMGDRAGRVAYLLPNPVIQTEGLMMDRNFLYSIEDQLPLRDVLAAYNVNYYIATAYKPFTGCYEAQEPAKAGEHSAHMRAEFCEPPLATFMHDGIETLIFGLKSQVRDAN